MHDEQIKDIFIHDLDNLNSFFMKLTAYYGVNIKSSKNDTLKSLQKFKAKFDEQTHIPYVLHTSNYKEYEDIIFLPLYMTPLL